MKKFLAVLVAAATLFTVMAVGAGPASALPSHSVTFTPSKRDIDFGTAVRFSGAVPSASPGKVVYIDQLQGRIWKPVAFTRTGANRRYSAGVVPRTSGYVKYRARVGADRSRAAGASLPWTISVYRWRYLADVESVRGRVAGDPARINGVLYTKIVSLFSCRVGGCTNNGTTWEWNLRRQCSTLQAVVGFQDDARTQAVGSFTAVADQTIELFNRTFSFGQVAVVSLPLSGRLRIALTVAGVSTNYETSGPFGVGNARIRCLW